MTVVSMSLWETHEEAELAVREAAEGVAPHLDGRVHRTSNVGADAVFWDGVGAR